MNDKYIIDYFWHNKICLYKRYLKTNKISQEIIYYLENRYNDSASIEETLYRIKNNIDKRPICLKCGKQLNFIKYKSLGKFNNYCSRSCQINQENIKKSILEKYNVNNVSQLQFVKDKIKKTLKNKYNVDNIFCLQSVQEKSKYTRKINKDNWLNKIKHTCIEKYGVDNVSKSDYIQDKIKNTCIIKYGAEYFVKSKYYYNSIDWNKMSEHQYLTKKKNNSFNISKPEDQSYELLKEKYPDVLKQYKSEAYPFNCDFYIPSLDLYIECNYHWTHGFHPYDPNSIEDKNKLELWKSKKTKFYDNAIKTWTIRDVNKRNIAKENKLNWIEFFSILKLNKWLENKYEI